MGSTRNVLVKLRDQDISLTCPETGWCIRRSEEIRTPKSYSSKIAGWIGAKALIVIEKDGEGRSIDELLDEPTDGKNVKALKVLAEAINEATGEKTIDYSGLNKKDLIAAIEEWKESVVEAKG